MSTKPIDQTPWLTKGILKSIKQKNKLFIRYRKKPNDLNKETYTTYRNKLSHIIRKSKKDYYGDLIAAAQGDSPQKWKVLNKALNRGQKKSVLPDIKDTDCDTLVGNFNDYFVLIGENLAKEIKVPEGASFDYYLSGDYPNSFSARPTNKDELHKIIMHMKNMHTAGHDNICSKILIAIADEIVEPLAHCINLSLSTGIVPLGTKLARIMPIF